MLRIRVLFLFLLAGLAADLKGDSTLSHGPMDGTVKLIHAEGKIFYDEIFISWSTEFEEGPFDFLIEASFDGNDWRTRGRVHSKGSTHSITEYKFVDAKNDHFRFYRIRKLDFNLPHSPVLSSFPLENYSIQVNLNSFSIAQEKRLALEYAIDKDQELLVRIYNRLGEEVITRVMPFHEAGEYIYHLDIAELPPDHYLLVVNQVLLDKTVAEKAFEIK